MLLLEQCLNGIAFGLLLFLLAAGLTLVFGIMDLVNLAHGSLYMMGAYFAATFAAWTGSFVLAAILALGATLLLGMALEVIALRKLYGRDHLDHVLATFGLILFFNELVRLIWGPGGLHPAAAGLAQRFDRNPPRPPLPGLPRRHHHYSARGGAVPLCPRHAHPARHADPRRRVQPRDGRRARGQHQPALHRWCSASARRSPGLPG